MPPLPGQTDVCHTALGTCAAFLEDPGPGPAPHPPWTPVSMVAVVFLNTTNIIEPLIPLPHPVPNRYSQTACRNAQDTGAPCLRSGAFHPRHQDVLGGGGALCGVEVLSGISGLCLLHARWSRLLLPPPSRNTPKCLRTSPDVPCGGTWPWLRTVLINYFSRGWGGRGCKGVVRS